MVTSTAPIAVISGGRGWSGICGVAGGCGDDGFDNILPTNQWGSIFTITNYPGANTGGEDVRVVADTDGTMVLVNGVLVATLDAGETHTFEPASGRDLDRDVEPRRRVPQRRRCAEWV
ncbi:MAG: IgGFc-binding protein [Sandaracinaceae bacterium]|nr:IgGFc-binding protein [Sandaracinaceae bacterium]